MSSTRNLNTKTDYCQEQDTFQRNMDYNLFKNSQYGKSYRPAIPNKGIGVPNFTMEERSTNGVDVESELFGIGSTNLVKPRNRFIPNPYNLPNICLYENDSTIIPKPLVVEKNQRYGQY